MDGPDPVDVEVGLTIRRLRKERVWVNRRSGDAWHHLPTNPEVRARNEPYLGFDDGEGGEGVGVRPSDLLPRTDAAPLPASASLLGVRGSDELLQRFALITSSQPPSRPDARQGVAGGRSQARSSLSSELAYETSSEGGGIILERGGGIKSE